ncbi:MAG: RluA family pseudouridine synthase [Candidatus Paceibacterota bacterium]
MEEIFEVKKINKPIRIDKYLKEKYEDISREKIINAIKKGEIKIEIGNKRKLKFKPSLLLRGGEKIFLSEFNKEKSSKEILLAKPLLPEPLILYEDENLLAIDKPSGVIVHPVKSNLFEPSIVSWLIFKFPFLKEVGEDNLRPGIVHRLDRETSGVLLVAKNNFAFNYLKNLFFLRKIKKKYLVLVRGEIKKKEGRIDFYLGRSLKKPWKRKIVFSGEGAKKTKTAITKFKVLKNYKDYTLLEVMPETGRTHQIRVHLAGIGFPVAGDKVYGRNKKDQLNIFPRQFIHAQEVSFPNLSGKLLTIQASLPEDLKVILKKLSID